MKIKANIKKLSLAQHFGQNFKASLKTIHEEGGGEQNRTEQNRTRQRQEQSGES